MNRAIGILVASAALALGAAPAGASVAGLYRCSGAQRCVYGPINESFPTYGNVYPYTLKDCTFAAAADWEQIKLGIEPTPYNIAYDFAQAGGTAAGLPQEDLWSYWREAGGIEGYVLTGLWRFNVRRVEVENAVLDYGAVIAQLQFGAGWGIGQYRFLRAGAHEVVVDGFTPLGPLVVTWGRTLQMTWEQWRFEARGMWDLAVMAES